MEPRERLLRKEGDGFTQIDLLESDFAGDEYIADLRRIIRVAIEKVDEPRILVNMQHVQYLSSAALGELVGAKRKIEKLGGKMCLASPTSSVNEIFHITRLDKAVPIYQTRDEAVKRLLE